jgi:hypothetical protein
MKLLQELGFQTGFQWVEVRDEDPNKNVDKKGDLTDHEIELNYQKVIQNLTKYTFDGSNMQAPVCN